VRSAVRTIPALSALLCLATVVACGPGASDAETGAPEPPLADVVSVAVRGEPGALELEVGVASLDTGCEQYADWWEVVDTDGRLLLRRVLRHSHVDEQPFRRSAGPVEIEPERTVWVRAHMHPTGYGGQAMRGSVAAGFAPATTEPGFAAELAGSPPLPEGCAF
jgi:hypothetical protein